MSGRRWYQCPACSFHCHRPVVCFRHPKVKCEPVPEHLAVLIDIEEQALAEAVEAKLRELGVAP